MLNDDDTRKTKNRMPQLLINDLRNKKTLVKSWWRQLKSSSRKSNKMNSAADDTNTTLDWRSLSPDRPPLPFYLPDNINDISADKQTVSSLADTTLLLTDPVATESNSSKSSNSRNNTIENYQPLCPILEESETMATESNESNILLNNDGNSQKSSIRLSQTATDSAQEPSADQQEPETSTAAAAFSSINTQSTAPWPEIKAIQKTPSDQYMPLDLVGNEDLCKRKFAKMVLAASKFQMQQQQHEKPSQMALLFDADGNIDMMNMVRQEKSECHKFCGNSQYVPPELLVNKEYQSESADIWVLGIFLYRMLVGRYPFSAANDQLLFKKMLNSDFSIPNELSGDAKDIIKRMLAPDSSRASLDLIIYHPWIKSYRPRLLDECQNNTLDNTMKSNYTNSNNSNNSTITQHPPLFSIKKQKQNIAKSNKSIGRSNNVNATAPSTTSSYAANKPKPKKSKPSTKNQGFMKTAFLLLLQGPFPPPKKPYQDLAHLGTRESVFAKHKV